MNCIIPGANMKIMSRAVQALAKIGDELYMEAKKDYLQLATINMNKTVYTTFNFHTTFFSTYNVGDAETNKDKAENVTCKIQMKSILSIFKFKGPRDKDKKIELCKIELENEATKMIFKLKYKQDVMIVHSVHLIDMEFVTVSYSRDMSKNQICAGGHFFTQLLANFQMSDDDINFNIVKDKIVVRNYETATASIARTIRSQVVLNSNEFSTFKINQETNVTLSFRPFRAAIQFAESFNLNVTLNFETGGRPVILLIKSPTFEADFVLSTINPDGQQSQSSMTTSPSLPQRLGHRQAEKLNISSQDENALDCVNWESDDFNDGEIYNKQKKKKTNNKNGGLINNGCDHNDGDVIPNSPESPRSKKARTVFGRCCEPTFHATMLDLGDVLAPNSDSDDNT